MVNVILLNNKYVFEIEYERHNFVFVVEFGAKQVIGFSIKNYQLKDEKDNIIEQIYKEPFFTYDEKFNMIKINEIESLFIFKRYQKILISFFDKFNLENPNTNFYILNRFKTIEIFKAFKKTLKNCNK